jgi:hypothetical protein
MKPNYLKISAFLLGALYIVGMLYVLYGCKYPQTIYKTEYKTIKDTLIVNGDTIIRNIEVKQDCPECEEKTRLETRLEYRLDKRRLNALKSMYEDSLNTLRKMNESNNDRIKYVTKWKTKEVVKVAETENSDWWKFWLGCAVAFGISLLIKLFIFKR